MFGVCMMAWVLFRANTISEAFYVFAHAFDGITGIRSYLLGYKDITKVVSGSLKDVLMVFIVLVAYDYSLLKHDIISWLSCRNVFLRRSVYVLFIIVFLMFLPLKRTQEFIYFQF